MENSELFSKLEMIFSVNIPNIQLFVQLVLWKMAKYSDFLGNLEMKIFISIFFPYIKILLINSNILFCNSNVFEVDRVHLQTISVQTIIDGQTVFSGDQEFTSQ